jgi:hypothetical protein
MVLVRVAWYGLLLLSENFFIEVFGFRSWQTGRDSHWRRRCKLAIESL